MNYIPCRDRTFPLWLSYDFEEHFSTYLYWLKHFLERLGHDQALLLWQQTFRDYDDVLLSNILSQGWQEDEEHRTDEAEEYITSQLVKLFPLPVEGMSSEEAREIIENTPPFLQIRQRFSTLDMMRESTTFEALHLFRDGLALLAETMIDRFGKAGELMVYDAMLAELAGEQLRKVSVEEFMAGRLTRFSSKPEEEDQFTAGLEVEVVRGSETEVVTLVKECEWARYFRERHPKVGYMLACSLDNAAYESFNERIHLQRSYTLMEGDEMCDFRVYADEVAVPKDHAE